jgi:hypothetical protein
MNTKSENDHLTTTATALSAASTPTAEGLGQRRSFLRTLKVGITGAKTEAGGSKPNLGILRASNLAFLAIL